MMQIVPMVAAISFAPTTLSLLRQTPQRACAPACGLFDFLKPDPEQEAWKDEQMREQQAILERRRNPAAQRAYMEETERARAASSQEAAEKFGWQKQEGDTLDAFLKRKVEGKLNKMGYEDEPQGGLKLPLPSFGVGGEFGVGGKYDNGERFDLRLPYAEKGYVPDADDDDSVDFFANLLSGGRLQREFDERARLKREKREGNLKS